MFVHCYFITIILFCLYLDTTQFTRYYDRFRRSKSGRKAEQITENPSKKETTQPTKFEIRSLLVKCMTTQNVLPSVAVCNALKKSSKFVKNNNLQPFPDDKSEQQKVTKCHRKILLTAQMFNQGPMDCKNQYLVVDHVYDPITECKVKLLNPYILKVKQRPIIQRYNLIFDQIVNSKAKEIVHNKEDKDYKGCNVGAKNPLCEPIYHKGKQVPYSKGFCCSCNDINIDQEENSSKCTSSTEEDIEFTSTTKKDNECTSTKKGKECTSTTKKDKECISTTEKSKECTSTSEESTECASTSTEPDDDIKEDLAKIPLESLLSILKPLHNLNEYEANLLAKIMCYTNASDANTKTNADNSKEADKCQNSFPTTEDVLGDLNKSEMEKLSYVLNTLTKLGEEDNNLPKSSKCESSTTKQIEFNEHEATTSRPTDSQSNPLDLDVNLDALLRSSGQSLGKEAPESNQTQPQNASSDMYELSRLMSCINSTLDVHDLEELIAATNTSKEKCRTKRDIHPRGGQDCHDKYTPPKVNPQTYHDSTHCLKFSEVWYSVYQLDKPTFEHSIQIQIFEKFEDENSNVRWRDLTGGKFLEVGTEIPQAQNGDLSVALTYGQTCSKNSVIPALDVDKQRLLIPEASKDKNIADYSETSGGPPEYLVVPKYLISSNGKECNKAGVGYEAFYKQPKRCSQPKGSCLGNQPHDFWEHDTVAECNGRKGNYFLKFFANLPSIPLSEDPKSHKKSISLLYEKGYTNQIQLEFKADHNTVLKAHTSAIITEVHIDSSCSYTTAITVKVINSGLVSSIFYVSLANCPLDMPASFNNIASKPALIDPQQQHSFILNIECQIPEMPFFCTVQILNTRKELIAFRRIRILQGDRCFCVWYCKCTCADEDDGLKCTPLALESFSSAGYQGGLPEAIPLIEYTFMDDVISIFLYLFLFVCSTLLIMGLTKALIGWCCSIAVGLWGFDVILNLPKRISSYHEPYLRDRDVEYSPSGWPINPDTKEKVRNVPPATEFCLNVVFFIVYPVMLTLLVVNKICCRTYRQDEPVDDNSLEKIVCKCSYEEEGGEGDEDAEAEESCACLYRKCACE